MSKEITNITTPVGRLVGGNPFEPRTEDFDGNPMTIKSGPNAGQPTQQYVVQIAIPKTDTGFNALWAEIQKVARNGFPRFFDASGNLLRKDFSWKYIDGDSTELNKKGNRPCDREGFPGHHILTFSSSYAPKVYHYGRYTEEIKNPAELRLGYYIRIAGNCAPNNNDNNPGVYLNLNMLELCGYGPEIVVGLRAEDAFKAPIQLPTGASATPVGQQVSGVPAGMAPAQVPAGVPVMAPSQPPFNVPAGVPGQVPPPAPDFLKPPVAPTKTMTAKSGGATYETFVKAGWTDDAMVQQGYMTIS